MKAKKNRDTAANNRENIIFNALYVFIIAALWSAIVTVPYIKRHPVFLSRFLAEGMVGALQFYPAFPSLLLSYIWAFFLLILTAAVFWAAGDRLLKIFKLDISGLENFVFSSALGMALASYTIMLIGFLGLLYTGAIKIIMLTAFVYALRKIYTVRKKMHPQAPKRLAMSEKTAVFLLIILIGISLLMTLVPETFYDSLVYILAVPDCYLINHKIIPMNFTGPSSYPLAMNMIYLLGLALFNGDILAKMYHFYCGIIILFSLIAFSAHFFKKIFPGLLAALFFFSTPMAAQNLWAAGTDVAGAVYVSLAVYSFCLYTENKNNRLFVLSSFFTGAALAIKYPNFFYFAGMLVTVFAVLVKLKFRLKNIIQKTSIFAFIALLVFSPWLIKNYAFTKNPFHPFLGKIFGAQHMREVENIPVNDPLKGLMNFAASPWTLTINGEGAMRHIGPVFLVFVPLIFLLRRRDNIIYILLIFSLASYVFWGASTSKLRYFIPALPALSVLAAFASSEISQHLKQHLKTIFITGVFLFPVINIIYLLNLTNIYRPFETLNGRIPKIKYLSVSRPGFPNPCYDVIYYVNKNLPEDAKILFLAESKTYGIKRKYETCNFHNYSPAVVWTSKVSSEDEYYSLLKQKGFTHIIVNLKEGIRLHVGYFDWSVGKKDIFYAFWDKYLTEVYHSYGSYLYEIKAPDKNRQPAINFVRELEKLNYKQSALAEIYNNYSLWDDLLSEYEEYARFGNDTYTQIAWIYLEKKKDAVTAEKVVRQALSRYPSSKRYRDFLNYLESLRINPQDSK